MVNVSTYIIPDNKSISQSCCFHTNYQYADSEEYNCFAYYKEHLFWKNQSKAKISPPGLNTVPLSTYFLASETVISTTSINSPSSTFPPPEKFIGNVSAIYVDTINNTQ